MSHRQQREFCARVRNLFPERFVNARVLDVGSLDVNGSTRGLFTCGSYLGIDYVAGKGVDRVCSIDDVEGQFDVVISTEALEHDPQWAQTLVKMAEKTKPGGLLVMTCAGPGRKEHGTRKCPMRGMANDTDHYRNISPQEVCEAMLGFEWLKIECEYEASNCDTYFFGIRK